MKTLGRLFICSIIWFVIGSLYNHYYWDKEPPTPVYQGQDTTYVYLPSKTDTVEKYIYKPVYITKSDTIYQTQKDTIIIKDTVSVVISEFNISKPEFNTNLKCFSMSAVDSIYFNYKLKENYINAMIQSRCESPWNKYFYLGGGILIGQLLWFLK